MEPLAFASASAPRGEPARRRPRRARKTLRDSPPRLRCPRAEGRSRRRSPPKCQRSAVRAAAEATRGLHKRQPADGRRAGFRLPRMFRGGEWLRRADCLSAVASPGCGRTVWATPAALPASPPKSPLRFRRCPDRDLCQRLLGIRRGSRQAVPKIRDKGKEGLEVFGCLGVGEDSGFGCSGVAFRALQDGTGRAVVPIDKLSLLQIIRIREMV